MIKTAICKAAKLAFLKGVHQPSDSYFIALYDTAAELDAGTEKYVKFGESSGPGYSPGGLLLTGYSANIVNGVPCLTWDDPVWPGRTSISAEGALIYNRSKDNAALAVFSFGAVFTSSNGDFALSLPAAGKTALIRFP